jgi:hypothetical protein
VSRPSRAELLYVAVCLLLLIVAVRAGGDHVWPYIGLAIVLLPPGMLAVVVMYCRRRSRAAAA